MALLERAPLTYEDYLSIPNDGRRHEIVDGEHCVSPAPSPEHQRIVVNLSSNLHFWSRGTGSGRVFVAPVDVVLDELTVVQPDVLWVASQRSTIVEPSHLSGAPNLLVEVLSPSSRRYDEHVKRELYERKGVDEYWIVDTQERSVRIWSRAGERFGAPRLLTAASGDLLTSSLLPGFEVALAEVFG
jgi:Uma2 family endonuclease